LLHDRQVNEHHAMDNHFDLMNAMVHVVMMMHYEDVNANVNVNVVLVDHNVVYMEYVVQQVVALLVVDDNNQLFLLIFLVLKMSLNLIHVEDVQFFHQLLQVYYHILIDQIHLDENVVVDHVLMVKVIGIEILIVAVVLMILLSMDNIIHKNHSMMMEHSDVLHVEQVEQLNKQLAIFVFFEFQLIPSCI
jgi:hypothetical protein